MGGFFISGIRNPCLILSCAPHQRLSHREDTATERLDRQQEYDEGIVTGCIVMIKRPVEKFWHRTLGRPKLTLDYWQESGSNLPLTGR
jgi:hypothetical protein